MEYDRITRYIYEFIQPNKTGRVLTRALSSISILAVAFFQNLHIFWDGIIFILSVEWYRITSFTKKKL